MLIIAARTNSPLHLLNLPINIEDVASDSVYLTLGTQQKYMS